MSASISPAIQEREEEFLYALRAKVMADAPLEQLAEICDQYDLNSDEAAHRIPRNRLTAFIEGFCCSASYTTTRALHFAIRLTRYLTQNEQEVADELAIALRQWFNMIQHQGDWTIQIALGKCLRELNLA